MKETWRKGISEDQRNSDSHMYGEENLIKRFKEKAGGKSLSEIKNYILKSLDDYETDDDITMILLKRIE